MAKINKDEVVHIANLAMINLNENEIERYTSDMQAILEYAEMINNVDTSEIDETISTTEQKNVFRKDEIKIFGNKEELLKNAPCQDEGMFRIPKVIN